MRKLEWSTIGIVFLWILIFLLLASSQVKAAQPLPPLVNHALTVFAKVAGTTPAQVAVKAYAPQRFIKRATDCPPSFFQRGSVKGYMVTLVFRGVTFDYAVDSSGLTAMCKVRIP